MSGFWIFFGYDNNYNILIECYTKYYIVLKLNSSEALLAIKSVLLIIYSLVMPKFVTFPFDSVVFEKEEHTSNDKPLLFVTSHYLTLQTFLATIEATIQRNLLGLLLFVTSAQPCVPSAV